MLEVRKGGSINVGGPGGTAGGAEPPPGRVQVWLRGRTFRAGSLRVGDQLLPVPRELNGPNQWIEAGAVRLADGEGAAITLERPKRSLRPGDAEADHVGPLVLVPDAEPEIVRVKSRDYRRLCGRRLDWVDVLRG